MLTLVELLTLVAVLLTYYWLLFSTLLLLSSFCVDFELVVDGEGEVVETVSAASVTYGDFASPSFVFDTEEDEGD